MAWFCRADSLAKLARYDEAPACYEKALEMQPKPRFCDMPEAMAQISEIQGNYARAIACGGGGGRKAREGGTSPKGKLWTCTAGKFSACGSVWSGNNKKQGAPERSSAPLLIKRRFILCIFSVEPSEPRQQWPPKRLIMQAKRKSGWGGCELAYGMPPFLKCLYFTTSAWGSP